MHDEIIGGEKFVINFTQKFSFKNKFSLYYKKMFNPWPLNDRL